MQRRNPKTYIDIGHGDRNVILWAHCGGRIESFRAGDDTHETLWGNRALNYWRGRFDKKTLEISVVGPVMSRATSVPQWLLDKLEAKFGTGLQTWKFNPIGRRVR